jgi:hypothetical protein
MRGVPRPCACPNRPCSHLRRNSSCAVGKVLAPALGMQEIHSLCVAVVHGHGSVGPQPH